MKTDKIPGFVYARITEQKPSKRYRQLGDEMRSLYKTIEQGASAEVREAVSRLDEVIGERECEMSAASYALGLQDGVGITRLSEPVA